MGTNPQTERFNMAVLQCPGATERLTGNRSRGGKGTGLHVFGPRRGGKQRRWAEKWTNPRPPREGGLHSPQRPGRGRKNSRAAFAAESFAVSNRRSTGKIVSGRRFFAAPSVGGEARSRRGRTHWGVRTTGPLTAWSCHFTWPAVDHGHQGRLYHLQQPAGAGRLRRCRGPIPLGEYDGPDSARLAWRRPLTAPASSTPRAPEAARRHQGRQLLLAADEPCRAPSCRRLVPTRRPACRSRRRRASAFAVGP